MPHPHSNRRAIAAAATTLLLLAAVLLLSACGGSSKGSSSATTTDAARTQGTGRFGARSASLRACLKQHGITLPERPPRQGKPGQGEVPGARGPFGTGGAGGPRLPKGVTRSQLEAAFKECGGGSFRAGARAFDSAAGRQRFAKFAECMRKNGVELPAPNTSGRGPIFNTKGIDTSSAAFKAAEAKCVKGLGPLGGRRAGGTPPASGEGGEPPRAGEGPPGEAPPTGSAPGGQ